MTDLYDVAREVTDSVFGEGAYAEMNGGNPDPGVQASIKRGPKPKPSDQKDEPERHTSES